MTTIQPSTKRVRRDCRYSSDEINAIKSHKEDFMQAGTQGDRVLIMKRILKDYFNYMEEKGAVPASVEGRKDWAKVG